MTKLAVVARYNEDVNWVKELTIPYIIYNKGNAIDLPCIEIENKGREGDTWLRYIIEDYYYLPDLIFFLQGNPFYHCHNALWITNTGLDSFLALGETMICNGQGFPHHYPLPIKETYHQIFNEHKEDLYTFSAGAQYIVPREMIINKSLQWWQRLYAIYSSHENSPWIFERLWQYIFNYENNTSTYNTL